MSLFDVFGCQAMRSSFDIRRCRYCSPLVVISNMRCVDHREGDETARAEVGRVGAGSASLPVTGSSENGTRGRKTSRYSVSSSNTIVQTFRSVRSEGPLAEGREGGIRACSFQKDGFDE